MTNFKTNWEKISFAGECGDNKSTYTVYTPVFYTKQLENGRVYDVNAMS